jgi:hypothetical protein
MDAARRGRREQHVVTLVLFHGPQPRRCTPARGSHSCRCPCRWRDSWWRGWSACSSNLISHAPFNSVPFNSPSASTLLRSNHDRVQETASNHIIRSLKITISDHLKIIQWTHEA